MPPQHRACLIGGNLFHLLGHRGEQPPQSFAPVEHDRAEPVGIPQLFRQQGLGHFQHAQIIGRSIGKPVRLIAAFQQKPPRITAHFPPQLAELDRRAQGDGDQILLFGGGRDVVFLAFILNGFRAQARQANVAQGAHLQAALEMAGVAEAQLQGKIRLGDHAMPMARAVLRGKAVGAVAGKAHPVLPRADGPCVTATFAKSGPESTARRNAPDITCPVSLSACAL